MEFKLHSEYHSTGDQPQAIEALVKGFKEANANHRPQQKPRRPALFRV